VNEEEMRTYKREYASEWRKKHPGRSAEAVRRYRERHPDKVRESQSEYHDRNRTKRNDEARARTRRLNEANRDRKREKDSEYYANNSDKIIEYQRNYKHNNPEKKRAQELVGRLLRRGFLVRAPCETCSALGLSQDSESEAHHEDYSKPKEVRWLCRVHHMRLHGDMKYGGSPPPPL
jgi:hypothetical protein